jgi:hypothetical protein
VSLFLRLSDRYESAIQTYDPLQGEWLCRIIDPLSKRNEKCRPSVIRAIGLMLLLYGPIWLFCSLHSPMFGGKLHGSDGIMVDIGLHGMFLFLVLYLVLIPVARRVLGALINELVTLGITKRKDAKFKPSDAANGRFLKLLERISRVSGYRGLIWFGAIMASNIINGYYNVLKDAVPRWSLSTSVPGTAFHFLHVGHVQPNLAGIWAHTFFQSVNGYVTLLAARLVIVFACLCANLARKQPRITPAHPDGTGGLSPIGQVALFFSLFTFVLGVNLAAMTANELLIKVLFPAGVYGSSSIFSQIIILWGCYLLLGTLLFFLPLVPLRARMAAAKRQYLLEALRMKSVVEARQHSEFKANDFKPESLQGMVALDALIQMATEMAIWPFDRKTFLRYAGLLITPFAPLVADTLPAILEWTRQYLHLS